VQAIAVVSSAYEDLARLSIFVEKAREGEMTAYHDAVHRNMSDMFHNLENYIHDLLCHLSIVYPQLPEHQLNSELALLTEEVVRDIRLVPGLIANHQPKSQAQRNRRDYATSVAVRHIARGLVRDMRRLIRHL